MSPDDAAEMTDLRAFARELVADPVLLSQLNNHLKVDDVFDFATESELPIWMALCEIGAI